MPNKGKMTVSEAGHMGGESTSKSHGHEFYQEIGKKGGKKGGAVVRDKYGHEFYEDIGHKGGSIGGPKVRELIQKGKQRS